VKRSSNFEFHTLNSTVFVKTILQKVKET